MTFGALSKEDVDEKRVDTEKPVSGLDTDKSRKKGKSMYIKFTDESMSPGKRRAGGTFKVKKLMPLKDVDDYNKFFA